jgi:hypothetical protein
MTAIADTAPAGDRSTPATFHPARLWGPQKLSAPAILFILIGIALCSTGSIGTVIGIPLAIASYFIFPKRVEGVWTGTCPSCGAPMSALVVGTHFDCPSCGAWSVRSGDRFIAAGAPPRD